MVGDLCPTKGGDMLRMAGDPWTIVCLSIKVIVQLRLTYNDEIHFCFYIVKSVGSIKIPKSSRPLSKRSVTSSAFPLKM